MNCLQFNSARGSAYPYPFGLTPCAGSPLACWAFVVCTPYKKKTRAAAPINMPHPAPLRILSSRYRPICQKHATPSMATDNVQTEIPITLDRIFYTHWHNTDLSSQCHSTGHRELPCLRPANGGLTRRTSLFQSVTKMGDQIVWNSRNEW